MTIAAKVPLWLAEAAWPSMQARYHGRIVLTTSDRALYPQYVQKGLAAYAAAKMAAVGIVNVLVAEGAPHNILVNAISPVAPGVAFLASTACRDGGWILRASNGQFHATRSVEADDVAYLRDLRATAAERIEDISAQ